MVKKSDLVACIRIKNFYDTPSYKLHSM